jgi:DNA-binding transcriptional LysR family regulator
VSPVACMRADGSPLAHRSAFIVAYRLNLIEEGIDVAVRIVPMAGSSHIIRKLGALSWIVCAAPVYLRQRGTPRSLADLSGHDCVVYSQDVIGPDGKVVSHAGHLLELAYAAL